MTTYPSDTTDTGSRPSPAGNIDADGTRSARRDLAWYALDEVADVRFLPSGTPLALRWRGNIWQVIGEPLTWSSSGSWTMADTAATTIPLDDKGDQTTRFWRFRVQTGPSSPVLEFDMSTHHQHESWRLRRVAGTTDY